MAEENQNKTVASHIREWRERKEGAGEREELWKLERTFRRKKEEAVERGIGVSFNYADNGQKVIPGFGGL